ncbi:Hypothetical protein D9617_78g011940 [Elsinoe fawcettii]|nr:Hypothetical protein D9617_78g011940 [Elsinoe fawcettii]
MSFAFSEEDKWFIEDFFRHDFTVKEVLVFLPHLKRTAVYRARGRFLLYGQIDTPKEVDRRGRPRKLTAAAMDAVLEVYALASDYYLDEVAEYLLFYWDIEVSEATLARRLAEQDWTWKVQQRIAAQRDPVKRSNWQEELATYRADQLVFVDESNVSGKTAWRRHGWSPKGTPAEDVRLKRRGSRWSLLPALSVEGPLPQPLIIQGSVTAEVFEAWIELAVLPQVAPYPAPRSIIVMDNCRAHRKEVSSILTLLCD